MLSVVHRMWSSQLCWWVQPLVVNWPSWAEIKSSTRTPFSYILFILTLFLVSTEHWKCHMYFSIKRSTGNHDFLTVSLRNGFTPFCITLRANWFIRWLSVANRRPQNLRDTYSPPTAVSRRISLTIRPKKRVGTSKAVSHIGPRIGHNSESILGRSFSPP